MSGEDEANMAKESSVGQEERRHPVSWRLRAEGARSEAALRQAYEGGPRVQRLRRILRRARWYRRQRQEK